MTTAAALILLGCFLLAATLYSSVGHAGASGYLAAMALLAVAPATMKPTALILNIVVASIAAVKFWRAGCFSWRLFWPFAVSSVPFAYLGGAVPTSAFPYRQIVAVVLLYSAVRLFLMSREGAKTPPSRRLPVALAIVLGAGIGFLSGLTGVGGGIFLSPLLVLIGWSDTRSASGVAAPFILVNSVAGLAGLGPSLGSLSSWMPVWIVAVVAGGWIGSAYGSSRLAQPKLRQLLSVVLLIAAAKLGLS